MAVIFQSPTIAFYPLNVPFAFPSGFLGSSFALQETIKISNDKVIFFDKVIFGATLGPLLSNAISVNGLTGLSSFPQIYSSIGKFEPTSNRVGNTDIAFAARRLTSSISLLQAVTSLSQIPFPISSIVGLNTILPPQKSLTQLIAENRLFMEDFTVFGLIATDAAKGSVVEAPFVLYFIDNSPRLRPLAIRFTINNQQTYSPADSATDWNFAKSVVNSMDIVITGQSHLLSTHFAMNQICIASEMSLASEHPIYAIIKAACQNNYGILNNGIATLINDGGVFEKLLSISANAIRSKIIPFFANNFDWAANYLPAFVAAKGTANIPNFHYYSDSSALFNALFSFSSSILQSYYFNPSLISTDNELAKFIGLLSTPSSDLYLKGFPTIASVTSVSQIASITAQFVWTMAVKHNAMNSNAVPDFYSVYPFSPAKIGFIPPVKGVLTDAAVFKILTFNNVTLFEEFFTSLNSFSYGFATFYTDSVRLDAGFNLPGNSYDNSAVTNFRWTLITLSNKITARNNAIKAANIEPVFDLLNPKNLPFNSFV